MLVDLVFQFLVFDIIIDEVEYVCKLKEVIICVYEIVR